MLVVTYNVFFIAFDFDLCFDRAFYRLYICYFLFSYSNIKFFQSSNSKILIFDFKTENMIDF